MCSHPAADSKLMLSAMYGRNCKPKIFTDITMPAKQAYGQNTGKKAQVLTSPIFMG
jgi:hypothetical protein